MKISITYLYTIYKYGYPPKIEDDFKALADIEQLGFHYLEMESLGPEHGEQVWRRRADLKKCLEDHRIHVHNFCVVDPDLVSLDGAKRGAALERLKRTAELGVYFGAETLHLASYAPPVTYLGDAPYQLDQDYALGDTFSLRIPDGFSWEQVWNVLVESCQKSAAVAKDFDRTIVMEPRVGEVICSVDSLLRLISDVGCSNFKANFDTGHFSAQRENVPLALMKLQNQYANIHISDNIPSNTDHLPVGAGATDWNEFFRILKLQGYDGYLGLDLTGRDSLADDYRQSVDYIKQLAGSHNIDVQV